MVTKGAFDNVLECCTTIVGEPVAVAAEALRARFEQLSSAGFRVLGVARRAVAIDAPFTVDDERGLDFAGFLTFSDPPKPGAREAIERLRALGVSVRLITGDNRLAARHIAGLMDLRLDGALVGSELATMDEDALIARVAETEVFAEVTPVDKERIVKALSLAGHTVGFLGDGINDTPALHVADVGISVDSAVDVAKQTADIVLLSKDLGVLGDGIEAGRSVFANTLKYVYVTTSANFGNMLSMAAAAAFLPFLPLLPTQILLLNFMSDIPGTTIATDRVDVEQLNRPRRWNVHQVRNFMIVFGLISTVFDLLTFATLRVGFSVSAVDFRSAWFIESTATELAVMLVLRTRRSCFRSRPSTALLISSALVLVATFALPYSPLAAPLGLDGPSPAVVAALLAIVVGYVVVTETLKHFLPMLFADEVIPSRP
jgi:Mg2+-importing ATPase